MWLRWKSFCTCENFSKPTFFKTSLFARQLIVRQFMKNLFYLSKNEIWKTLQRWPQWEKKSYHCALLLLMDQKEIQVYESFLYVIEAVPVLPWNTLPIEFQSNYSQGRQNSLLLFYIFFLRVHTTNTNLSSSLPSPNAICYKIGEKICDQFNNGFMLMVSGCYSCPTDFIFCVTLVLMINI